MSYVYGLGAAPAADSLVSACAAGCQDFDNSVRRGKCNVACTTATTLADCQSRCDSSFDTKARKDRCKAVCEDAWIQGGAAILKGPIIPMLAVAGVGVALFMVLFRKRGS